MFHDLADRRIHGNPAFGLQFAERHMDGPLIRAEREQAIKGQIDALADAHAGVALEQQEITEEIIAALQFLLDELILFRQQWTRRRCSSRRGTSARESRWARAGICWLHASSSNMRRKKVTRMAMVILAKGGVWERRSASQPRMCGSRCSCLSRETSG